MTKKVVCIGGASVETTATACAPIALGASNPVTTHASYGGVARNIAENLSLLQIDTALISRVGEDSNGRAVVDHLANSGVDVAGITISSRHPTATYVAINEPDGELTVGAAEMAAVEEITDETIAPALISQASYLLVDSNLTPSTLQYLADALPDSVALWAVVAALPKTRRLAPILSRLSYLFLNHEELSALSLSRHDLEGRCQELLEKGVKAVVVTLGAQGIAHCTSGGITYYPPFPSKVVDVGGSGDALVTGILYGHLHDLAPAEAAACGLAMAARTLGVLGSVDPTIRAKEIHQQRAYHVTTP